MKFGGVPPGRVPLTGYKKRSNVPFAARSKNCARLGKMRTALWAMALSLSGAQVPTVSQASSKFVPGVTWRPNSVLTADFTCRGRKEQAILGITAQEIVIAVFLDGLTEAPEILRYSADVRDARDARLSLESLDYDPKDDVGDLPGFRRSRTCQGLNLSDDKIDSSHIYWNHDAKRFNDWVR